MNEEDIKVKFVLPWLAEAGLTADDLRFERTFSVRLGRQVIDVPGPGEKNRAGARLDILVRRNNRNLFIVETKAPSVALTDDDRDQAISYARLVHPIAPYAVVTNGTEYRLYDAVSKRQISPGEIKIGDFEIALPDSDLAEAQRLFLRLNSHNLLTFCRLQVADELRVVKGTIDEGRKYVPELHVPRDEIRKEVDAFYAGPSSGLLLIGQSGSGKTSELCALAETLIASGKPVMFFNGFSLQGPLLDAIARQFAWTFSGSHHPIETLKRLESFTGDQPMTIVVDAIDEWTFESRVSHLSELLTMAGKRGIKFIFSCKASAVEEFLTHRDNPTPFRLSTKQVTFPPLTPKEFFAAIENYRLAYDFSGAFEDTVLNQAKENPFLLRVLFDVARSAGAKHLTFGSSTFFETYYARALNKTSDRRLAGDTLTAIAEMLYDRNADWLLERDIRAALGLRLPEELMSDLFEHSILQRSAAPNGQAAVSFYFQQLRDYVIAFKAKRLDALTPEALDQEFRSARFPSLRGDVFTLYYRLASSKHKEVFDREIRANARQYLALYTSVIAEHFPSLKQRFEPQTQGRIGFIGELLLSHDAAGAYGFRPIGDDDEDVYFYPVQTVLGKSNVGYLSGADRLHLRSSARGFRDGMDIATEVSDGEVLPQIRTMIAERNLNEANNPQMLMEFIIESIYAHRHLFRQLLDKRARIRYPLSYDAALQCLRRKELEFHYQEELVTRKRRSGEIPEMWSGTTVSYSLSLSPSEQAEISAAAEQALKAGTTPKLRARDTALSGLHNDLREAVAKLNVLGQKIEGPLFHDDGWRETMNALHQGKDTSLQPLQVYLAFLQRAVLDNYKLLVERSFPTIKKHFRLYSQLPLSTFIVIGNVHHASGYPSIPLTVYFAKPNSGETESRGVDGAKLSEDHGQVTIDGVSYEVVSIMSTSVSNLLSGWPGNPPDAFRGMHLREMVYSELRREFRSLEAIIRGLITSPLPR